MGKKDTVLPLIKVEHNDTTINVEMARQRILDELVLPGYYRQVKDLLDGKYTWRKIGNITESFGQVILFLGAMFAFASSSYDNKDFTFIAGSCSLLALLLARFSTYAFKESAERIHQVNKTLRHLGIDEVPSFTQGDSTQNEENKLPKAKKITAFEVGDVIDVHKQFRSIAMPVEPLCQQEHLPKIHVDNVSKYMHNSLDVNDDQTML
jgi:hypothetical protein